MIVVEGADAAGKSTLINVLKASLVGWKVQASEGPPKYDGEMEKRVQYYLLQSRRTIYDRHPCVSQPIYGKMRSHLDPIPEPLIKHFYSLNPLFIYCDGQGMKNHTVNPETDSKRHLEAVNNNYNALLMDYREWAVRHAVIMYRIGDPMLRVVKMVEALVNK